MPTEVTAPPSRDQWIKCPHCGTHTKPGPKCQHCHEPLPNTTPEPPIIRTFGVAVEAYERGDWHVGYIVDQLIPAQGLSLLVANPKVGKTTFARACALAVATPASQFFGQAIVPSNVLILSFDEWRGYTMAHLTKLARAKNIDPNRVALDLVFRRDADTVAQLRAAIRETKANLVFIDTMHHIVDAESFIDYKAVADAIIPIREIAQQHDCHICMLHHARKERSGNGVNQVSGSARLAGDMDQVILLERKADGTRTLTTHGRGNPIGPLVVKLDENTGAITNGGQYTPRSKPGTERDATIREYMEQDDTRTYTISVIAAATGLGKDAVRNGLKSLQAAKRVALIDPSDGPKPATWGIA